MTTTQSTASAAPHPWVAAHENEFAVRILLDHTALPAPTLVGEADGAYISVADPDHLLPWLETLGGEIHISPEQDGFRMWVLHTAVRCRHRADVPVRVAALVTRTECVLPTVRAAVVRPRADDLAEHLYPCRWPASPVCTCGTGAVTV